MSQIRSVVTYPCVRCGVPFDWSDVESMCPSAPDRGPCEAAAEVYACEGIEPPEFDPEYDPPLAVRRGFSLHVGRCPRSNPSPLLPLSVACTCGETP